MPWARIPPDKLIHLPLFGIDVIHDDGDFVWMRGPAGRMRVDKRAPRIWFESISDAHQAGALGIRITSQADGEAYEELLKAKREQNATEGSAASNPGVSDEKISDDG